MWSFVSLLNPCLVIHKTVECREYIIKRGRECCMGLSNLGLNRKSWYFSHTWLYSVFDTDCSLASILSIPSYVWKLGNGISVAYRTETPGAALFPDLEFPAS